MHREHHEAESVHSSCCRGKRTGVFGAFLLAIYDDDAEEYQAISKIGTGFSEVLLKELADSLREHIIDSPRPYYKCAYLNAASTVGSVQLTLMPLRIVVEEASKAWHHCLLC